MTHTHELEDEHDARYLAIPASRPNYHRNVGRAQAADHRSMDRGDSALDWLGRAIWIAMIVAFLFICGGVIAYVGAPAIRALMDAAVIRPEVCMGLTAAECGEAMGAL